LYPAIRQIDSLDGVSWLDTIYIKPIAGVSQVSTKLDEELKLFPNPASNLLSLWFNHSNAPVAYTIINQTGAVIKQQKSLTLTGLKLNVDVSDIPAGTYIIRLEVDGEVADRKIVIQH
jgi:hypothetical protein